MMEEIKIKRIEDKKNNNRHRPAMQVCCSAGNSDKGPVVKDAQHPLPSRSDMKLDHILVLDQRFNQVYPMLFKG